VFGRLLLLSPPPVDAISPTENPRGLRGLRGLRGSGKGLPR